MTEITVPQPTDEQRKLLDQHLRLVIEENKTTNLTRIVDWESAQILHIEDSIQGFPEFSDAPEGRYLDMGSGAGFPGIPLAILSGRDTLLADSVGKKTKALDKFISELGLSVTVSTYHGRIEDLATEHPGEFSVVTARALSQLSSLLELASPLLCKGGSLVCYKTQAESEELSHAKAVAQKLGMEFVSARGLVLSDGETQRAIIVFRKRCNPSMKLPRRVGLAQKKPF